MDLPADWSAKHCHIAGRVQNVWYRAWTIEQAQARGLKGWVRNRLGGSVEAVFIGPVDQVADMIRACHQGPEAARVDAVAAEDYTGDIPDGFTKRRDA